MLDNKTFRFWVSNVYYYNASLFDRREVYIFSAALGLTLFQWVGFVVAGGVLALWCYRIWKVRPSLKDMSAEWELVRPTEEAKNFTRQHRSDGEEFVIIGNVIEYVLGPVDLQGEKAIGDQGWSVDTPILNITNEPVFSWLDRQDRIRELVNPPPLKEKERNATLARWRKIEFGASDDCYRLSIEASPTDYYTRFNTAPYFQAHPDKRIEYGQLDPGRQLAVGAIVLHFLCIFADNKILCRSRPPSRVGMEQGKLGISAEETFFIERRNPETGALEHDKNLPEYFARTLREEIASYVEDIVSAANKPRIIAIGYEEPLVNHFLFGVFEMKMSSGRYIERMRQNRISAGGKDNEGRRYIIDAHQGITLLKGKQIKAEVVEDSETVLIHPDSLHVTSAYRLYRGLELMKILRCQSSTRQHTACRGDQKSATWASGTPVHYRPSRSKGA